MSVCPFCNAGLEPEANFCEGCGSKVQMSNICPSCKTQLIPGKKFCHKCGEKVTSERRETSPGNSGKEHKKKNGLIYSGNRRNLFFILFILSALIVFITVILNIQNIKNYFKSADEWYKEGMVLTSEGKYEEALKCYDKVLSLKPLHKESLISKGNIFLDMDECEKALKCYDELLECEPYNLEINLKKADILYGQEKYDEAHMAYDRILEIAPDNLEVISRKGDILYKQEKYDEALPYFDKALKINPEYIKAWIAKGEYLCKQDKFKEAIGCFDKALEIEPADFEVWNSKGLALYRTYNYEESIKCFDKALELDETYSVAWNNKGWSFYCLEKYDDSVKCFNKATELDPSYAEAWSRKGLALYIKKNYKEAIECFDKVLELEADYPGVEDKRKSAEKALADEKKREELEKIIEEGKKLTGLGKYSEAIKNYEKAIEIKPDSFDTWYEMGNTLYAQGVYARSQYCYEKALEIIPDNKVALKAKEKAQATSTSKFSYILLKQYENGRLCDITYRHRGAGAAINFWRDVNEGKGNVTVYSDITHSSTGGVSYDAYCLFYPKLIMTMPEDWINNDDGGAFGCEFFMNGLHFKKWWEEEYYGDRVAEIDLRIFIKYGKNSQDLHNYEREVEKDYSDKIKTTITLNGLLFTKYSSSNGSYKYDTYIIFQGNTCYTIFVKSFYNNDHSFDKSSIEKEVNKILNSVFIVEE